MVDSAGLEAILTRLETGKRLSKQDLQVLVVGVRSQQVTIATGDRAVAIGGSADGAVIVTGDQNFVINAADAEALREFMGIRPRIEKQLLEKIKGEVTSWLKDALHNQGLIQLGMEAQPKQVKRLRDLDIKIDYKPAEPIPEGWSILQVFEEAQGRLLILGDPGAGKTTMMMELARGLCDRAEEQADFPIPVLFSLTSWENSSQSIRDWLIEELKLKHKINKIDGQKLMDEGRLILLLDGLDELRSIRREPCLMDINHFLESENCPRYLVICSRSEEYEESSNSVVKLQMNLAIYLRELSNDKIQDYLIRLDQEDLGQEFIQDTKLLAILRKPLFLRMAVLCVQQLSVKEWKQLSSTELQIQYLLDSYIQYRLILEKDYPSQQQSQNWLIYLAKELQQSFQTEFLIENIQPSWLPTKAWRAFYRVLVIMLSGILGMIYASCSFLLNGSLLTSMFEAIDSQIGDKENYNLFFADYIATFLLELIVGLAVGLICGLIIAWKNSVKTLYTPNWSLENIERRLAMLEKPIQARLFQLLEASFHWLSTSNNSDTIPLPKHDENATIKPDIKLAMLMLFAALFTGVRAELNFDNIDAFFFALTPSIILWFTMGLGDLEPSAKSIPNQGIIASRINSRVSLIIGTLVVLSYFLFIPKITTFLDSEKALSCMLIAQIIVFCVALFLGGSATIQHLTIRAILWFNGLIPWNYANFLQYATERTLIQCIGGRYRFIHRLLQEHFAAMPLENK